MADPISASVAAVVTAAKYIGASFAAVSAGTATTAQVATVIATQVTASTALTAAANALYSPKLGGGSPSEWVADGQAGVPFVVGRMGVAGNIVYRKEYGRDNRYQSIVTVYSGAGPIDGYETFTADGVALNFGTNGVATNGGNLANNFWMQRRLGAQPDTALSSPSGLDNGATLPGWGASHRLSGFACSMITLRQDSKFATYPAGEPQPMQVLRGIRVYDPRQDSTYPGGSGSQRLVNRATWGYTTNPIIHALNWTLGYRHNGKLVGGIGADIGSIDVAAYVSCANVADANGWTIAGRFSSLDDKHNVLVAMLQAGGAMYSERAGRISCVTRGAPRTSIASISVADTAGPVEITSATPLRNRLNTVYPRCIQESFNWEVTQLAPVIVSDFVTADGGQREREIEYPFVTNSVQASQLAAFDIVDSREGIAGVIPLKPYMRELRPGDAFTIDEPGFLLDGQKCLVLDTAYDPGSDVVRVTFRAETDQKYPFALGLDPTPPSPPALTPGSPYIAPTPDPSEWVADGGEQEASDGSKRPVIIIGGDLDAANINAVWIEYRETGQTDWTTWGIFHPEAVDYTITGIKPNTAYEVSVRYQNAFGVWGERIILGPFTTGGEVASDALAIGGKLATELQDDLDSLDGRTSAVEQGVEDLVETYGSTESAAASAAAAEAARDASQTARDQAQTAAGNADGSATAAAGSASSAATSADDAATSATAASASVTAAETARSGAETAATQASTARDDAQGSAAAAQSSATTAANSANDAGGHATAAANSASSAASSASDAGNSATAASTTRLSVEATARRYVQPRRADNLLYWATSGTVGPDSTALASGTIETAAGEGSVWQRAVAAGATAVWYPKASGGQWVVDRVIEVRARLRCTQNNGGNFPVRLGLIGVTGDGGTLSGAVDQQVSSNIAVANGWQTFTVRITLPSSAVSPAVWKARLSTQNSGPNFGVIQLAWVDWADVTSEIQSDAARATAEIARDDAVGAKQDAEGAAAAAGTSQSLAASAATNAGASATASASSASLAQASASEAGGFAASAEVASRIAVGQSRRYDATLGNDAFTASGSGLNPAPLSGWNIVTNTTHGQLFSRSPDGTNQIIGPRYPVRMEAGKVYTVIFRLRYNGADFTGTAFETYLRTLQPDGTTVVANNLATHTFPSQFGFRTITQRVTAPDGTGVWLKPFIRLLASWGNRTSSVEVQWVVIEENTATVQTLAGAYLDANGNAVAQIEKLVDAGGGNPAYFQMRDGQGGSRMALIANQIVMGGYSTGGAIRPVFLVENNVVQVAETLLIGGSPTGQRAVIQNGAFEAFDANNVRRVRLGVW